MSLTIRQVTVAGILGGLTLVLGVSGIGFIPVPTPAGAMTFAHLPAVLAGITGGPIVGVLVGLIFGLTTFKFLPDLRVVIPARVLIGPAAYLVYAAIRRAAGGRGIGLAAPVAAVVGSLVNTVGTLSLAVAFGYIPLAGRAGALGIALFQGGPEALASAIVLTPIVYAVSRISRRA
ncbi:MAG: hypothetical protein BWY85_02015 [Firmicutes bacterium ADurb.Bin506]|nr:MAG: hypothetical protein BWY85_02015 [Firmicutes bacterium ADurb.Bin506]